MSGPTGAPKAKMPVRWQPFDDLGLVFKTPPPPSSQEETPSGSLDREILLGEALDKLAGVVAQAAKDGYPVPSQDQVEQAERLLQGAIRIGPVGYDVYATPQAEIAIDFTTDDFSIALYSKRDGSSECFVDKGGTSQSHAWYRNSDEALGAFFQDALSKQFLASAHLPTGWSAYAGQFICFFKRDAITWIPFGSESASSRFNHYGHYLR